MQVLPRTVGVGGATLLGLGSILGSGIFVAVALATQVAGAAVLVAIVIAAAVATCNALSSAQLAAEHPVSGGTYAYGHRHLHPFAGFSAGWVFLIAKSLSAAVAAIGAAAYLLRLLGLGADWIGPGAALAALVLTALAAGRIRRSTQGNAILVGITLLALLAFTVLGAPRLVDAGGAVLDGFWEASRGDGGITALLYASALMFVAFAGYARVATLGEEIREPEKNLPRAIIATIGIALGLYLAVTAVALAAMGPAGFAGSLDEGAAPLETAARVLEVPLLAAFIAVAAVTALVGVLLNLILGLSRVLLAMAREGDMPRFFARLDPQGVTPRRAVIAVGLLIALLAGLAGVRGAWSLSAFAVLIYYALTNAAALRLPAGKRLYPRWIAWAGLFGTLGLAAFVEPRFVGIGLGLLIIGGLWFLVAARIRRRRGAGDPAPPSSR